MSRASGFVRGAVAATLVATLALSGVPSASADDTDEPVVTTETPKPSESATPTEPAKETETPEPDPEPTETKPASKPAKSVGGPTSVVTLGLPADLSEIEPPYLRWRAVNADEDVIEGTAWLVTAPGKNGISGTVADNTGEADYEGADLDATPGVFMVKEVIDDEDSEVRHDVVADGGIYELKPIAAKGYKVGDAAKTHELAAAEDVNDIDDLTLTAVDEASQSKDGADPEEAALEDGPQVGLFALLDPCQNNCAKLTFTSTVGAGGSATRADWDYRATYLADDDWHSFSLDATTSSQDIAVLRNRGYVISAAPKTAAALPYSTSFTCTTGGGVTFSSPTLTFNNNNGQASTCTFTHTYRTGQQSASVVVTKRTVATPLGAGANNTNKTDQIGTNYTDTVGAVFQLYTNVGNAKGVATGYTCTITAGGACTITVPNANLAESSGGNQGKRFWVVEDATPSGTYSNPLLYVGANSGPTTARAMLGLTQAIAGNATQNLPMTATTGTDKTQLTTAEFSNVAQGGSYGAIANSRTNPTIQPRCTISDWPNIALVLDGSSSIEQSDWTRFRDAIVDGNDSVLGILSGTQARVSVLIFGQQNLGLTGQGGWRVQNPLSVSVPANRTTLANSIPTARPNSAGTNWQSALKAVADATQTYDLVIFVTDGAPNAVIPTSGGTTDTGVLPNSPNVTLRSIEAAIYAANAIKAEGTRVLAVGVGGGITSAGPNLRSVSGTVLNSDYFQTTNWSALKTQLGDIAKAATCQVPIEVSKTTIDGSTTTPQATGWTFGAGFTVAGSSPAGVTIDPASGTQTTTTAAKTANWTLKFTQQTASLQNASVTLTETTQPGWTLTGVSCTLDGQPVSTSITGGNSVTVSGLYAGSGKLACVFTNTKTQLGTLAINKAFDSSVPTGSGTAVVFSGTYTCTLNSNTVASGTWTRTGTGAATLTANSGSPAYNQIPAGASCTATETPPAGSTGLPNSSWAWDSPSEGDAVTIVNNGTVTITVTNKAKRVYGNFSITKAITPTSIADTGLGFGGGWSCTLAGDTKTGTWSVTDTGTWTSPSAELIPLGATCTVTSESTRPLWPVAADHSYVWGTANLGSAVAAAADASTAKITVTNPITRQLGTLAITKAFDSVPSGYGNIAFGGTYTCTLNSATVASGTWSVTGAGAATLTPLGTGIPVGSSCEATETPPTGSSGLPNSSWAWDTHSVGPAVTITNNSTVTITVTNKAKRVYGNFSVTKAITPSGIADAGLLFGGAWTCTLPNAAGTGTPAEVKTGTWGTIAAGATWTSSSAAEIPLGATCVVTSESTRPAWPVASDHSYVWGTADLGSSVTAAADASTAKIIVTNPITRVVGALAIVKAFDGVPAGHGAIEFTGAYTCTLNSATVASGTWKVTGEGDAVLTPDSGSLDVDEIPIGASCSATETQPTGSTGLPNSSWTWDAYTVSAAVTIENPGPVTITVTNKAKRVYGNFSVTKLVAPAGAADSGLKYEGTWECTLADGLGDGNPEVTQGDWGPIEDGGVWDSTAADEIPLGSTCAVKTETRPEWPVSLDHSYQWDGDPTFSSAVVTISGTPLPVITVTNTIKRVLGSVTWRKVAAGSNTPLRGSEWKIVGPSPATTEIAVVDCVEDDDADCTGPDKDRRGGYFKVMELAWGSYQLIETMAPPGYVLDSTPHPFTVGADALNPSVGTITNNPGTAPELPLTGGLSRDFYTLLGVGVMGLALLSFGIARSRTRRRIGVEG